jgi:uncharacterized membrane protein
VLLHSGLKGFLKQTSGEIRIYIESKNPYVNSLDRARELFFSLKMNETKERNAVLIYLAMKHREVALFGDEGIHLRAGQAFWEEEVKKMLIIFSNQEIVNGITQCIATIGSVLSKEFPFDGLTDKNELPDEIVFGK